jgi:hypothetical protein
LSSRLDYFTVNAAGTFVPEPAATSGTAMVAVAVLFDVAMVLPTTAPEPSSSER